MIIVAVLLMMTAVVGCARNAEMPEVIAKAEQSDNYAIFFKGIEGATGYELKMYISESHAMPYEVTQWAPYQQTGIPDVYFVVSNYSRHDLGYFTLEPTSGTANARARRDLQRIRLINVPDAIFIDANGDHVSYPLTYAHSIDTIIITDRYVDHDDNVIEKFVDDDGNVMVETCLAPVEGNNPRFVCDGHGGIEYKREVIE